MIIQYKHLDLQWMLEKKYLYSDYISWETMDRQLNMSQNCLTTFLELSKSFPWNSEKRMRWSYQIKIR